MTDINKTWYCIVNPRAGSGKTMSAWIPAERKLEKLGVPFITEYTDYKKHATSLAYEAARAGYRRFAAVGGDGSLHEMFSGICRFCEDSGTSTSQFYVAVVPIGSGNDWIKSLGVSGTAKDIAEIIGAESFQAMDVVGVSLDGGVRCYMANVGGTGFDSHVCKRVNQKKERGLRGKGIYFSSLIRSVLTIKPIRIHVVADGKSVFEGECYSVALGNGCYSGSGMRQVPNAELNDGLLDVMIVPKLKIGTIFKEVPRLFRGTLDQCDKVVNLRCKEIVITPLDNNSEDIVEVDGEVEGRLPLRISLDGRKINVIASRRRGRRK